MSTFPARRRRLLVATGAVVAASAVLVGGTAAGAAADPPELNVPTCSTTLARVQYWPGPIGTGDALIPDFTDAYESHLASSPECSSRAVPG